MTREKLDFFIKNGVSIVQCTVNGIGERAGNTSLEELIMALRLRKDCYYNARTNINTKELFKTSRLVCRLTGLCVSANKAIVGENVFASEAGCTQHGSVVFREINFES